MTKRLLEQGVAVVKRPRNRRYARSRQNAQRRSRQGLRPTDTQAIVKPKWRLIWLFGLLLLWLVCTGAASFQPLAYRLEQYPQWNTKPPVEAAAGDLAYPSWFEGTWQVETTLVEMTAPLAPDVVTPGFESNRAYLDQPVSFQARFTGDTLSGSPITEPNDRRTWLSLIQSAIQPAIPSAQPLSEEMPVVADRAFNGLNLARAYLNQAAPGMGDRLVLNVTVDPKNPNQQMTKMTGDRQLVSTITGRRTEAAEPNRFITTEVFQQVFRGIAQPYLNEVETTTDYRYAPENPIPITADQITAVYLSPQDPDYFKAGDRPVALYRYHLDFHPPTEGMSTK